MAVTRVPSRMWLLDGDMPCGDGLRITLEYQTGGRCFQTRMHVQPEVLPLFGGQKLIHRLVDGMIYELQREVR